MAFSLTYSNILDSSLKNIYSGEHTTGTITRTVTRGPPPVKRDDKYVHPKERFRLRQSQFWPRWNSSLPRAPAFRSVSQKNVSLIVDRLSAPIRRDTENKPERGSSPGYSRPKSSRKLEHTVDTSQYPTVSSHIRQRILEGSKRGSFPDIRSSCERFRTKPSQRYGASNYSLSTVSGQTLSP